MDFRFNINNLLPKRINKITHTLIPENFKGDRREYNECQRLLTRILDDMGEASAKAQGLNRTITSALKLRDTDHTIYLLVDSEGNNGLGCVIGLLKTGSKSLFMFDENGVHYQLKPRCILDFYIHESRQRMGLGNELYQYMLAEENLKPIKLAIDRPSDKFLAFLMKHYQLTSVIPQNNKFVVFKGFFDDEIEESQSKNKYFSPPSPNKKLNAENSNQSINNDDVNSIKNMSNNGTPLARSAYGRYAASRPPCSMANIIHNTMVEQPAEQARPVNVINTDPEERPDSLNLFPHDENKKNVQDNVITDNDDAELNKKDPNEISLQDFQNKTTISQTNSATTTPLIDKVSPKEQAVIDKSGDNQIDEMKNDKLSTSSLCSQDIDTGNQQPSSGHIDLKFYHSPLW